MSRRRRLVLSRTIGRADDCEWIKPEMAGGHEAPKHGLQCNRVDCNQRRGFAEQPRHMTILPPWAAMRPGRLWRSSRSDLEQAFRFHCSIGAFARIERLVPLDDLRQPTIGDGIAESLAGLSVANDGDGKDSRRALSPAR